MGPEARTPWLRPIFCAGILGLLGFASYSALRALQADALMKSAKSLMSEVAASKSAIDFSTWKSLGLRLDEAAIISEGDPGINELRGLLFLEAPDGRSKAESEKFFQLAIKSRPTSPYSWAHLAEAFYLQGDTGQRFEFSITQAAALGPSEPEVQSLIADYGLAVFDEVSSATRAVIERQVAAGVRRKPLELLQISERRGRLDIACRHLVKGTRVPDPTWYKLCQSTEATP
jgi:hypothetical protein